MRADGLAYTVLDVFTEVPLEGNPLAVFTDASGLSDEQMQRLAREMNLSETVFLLPGDEADARARIFTPATELPFAGHPVLGTAFLLGAQRRSARVALETGAGVIPVELRLRGDEVVFGEMDQPVPTPEPFEREDQLLAAIGVQQSALPVEAYRNGPLHVYVELESESALAALSPDMNALARLGPLGVSCFAGADFQFKTRMFAPGLGVAEDPATGSAAGPLAVHLARHGRIAYGAQIEVRQGTEIGRPSLLHARVEGDRERWKRVVVGGSAVVVASGQFHF